MLFKECFKIHIIEYRANQGNVFPKKSSYCKDHAIQGFVNQGPTVFTKKIEYLFKFSLKWLAFWQMIPNIFLFNSDSK